ncbi:MAG: FtsX-like permease family protein [Proteobacteria bacterium]|nr:FtsX-like permease family protein [Pseudomonadota bacterium]
MRLKALDRKLLRDLWRLRWQVLAIALLIACGVSVTVMAFSAQQSLRTAQQRYYAQTRFADVFASAKRAPAETARRLAAIEGVSVVDTRVAYAGLMEVPGLSRPATARVISLPDDPAGGLNRIVLQAGRMPDPARNDEAVAVKAFLDAAHVRIGDRLTATIGGRALSFRIVGSALSPEYVYVPSPESTMPDDAHQGVFWMPRPVVERAAGLGGAFNTVALKLAAGASPRAVMASVDRILAPYGGAPAYERVDQSSNAFLEAELKELSKSATIFPPVFLLVAAALVNLVIGRLVGVEREQIGMLKAFGYSDFEAARPYLRLAMAIGVLGAAGGGVLGLAFGAAITDLYAEYMRFPRLSAAFSWPAFTIASAVAIAATSAGSLGAVRRAVRLSPAVAMQPARPSDYRAGLFERLGLTRRLDQPTRMILRSLERFPVRAGLTVAGLAASLTLLVGTLFMFRALDYVLDHVYYRTQRWSEAVGFAEVRDVRAISAVRRLPGVYAAEPVRLAGARVRANGREARVLVSGVEPWALMDRALDRAGRALPFEGRGVVLSEALARKLSVGPGQAVDLEITEPRRGRALLPVTATAEDYSGLSVYIARPALNRLLAEGDVATGAQLLVRPDARPAFYREIERVPQIVAAASRDDTVANWRRVTTESFRISILIYIGFAGAIAFGVAFNTGRIALAERGRDIATLHVLGFDHRECGYVLLGELALLALLATPLGLVAGDLFAQGIVLAYSRDELRIPATIGPETYAVALTAYFAAVLIACVIVGRRIWTLDLVAVLKTRE